MLPYMVRIASKVYPDVQFSFRIPKELDEAINAEVERLKRERPGAVVHRSDAVREALWRALKTSKGSAEKE